MTAPTVTEYTSWCQKERRAVTRSRIDHGFRAEVLLARACYLASHGGVIPRWEPSPNLRSTYPKERRAA